MTGAVGRPPHRPGAAGPGHARRLAAGSSCGLPALFTRRRRFQSVRQVSDAEVASLQGVRGSARLRGYRRQRAGGPGGAGRPAGRARRRPAPAARGRGRPGQRRRLGAGPGRAARRQPRADPAAASRRRASSWPGRPGPFVLAREYLGGWWSQGLGGTRPVPTGMGLSAVLGLVTFGANGLPRTLLVVGPLFAGALGLWRLARAIAPSRAAAAALAVYVAAPLAANAVGTGSLSGLLVYGALPWTLHGLARLHARAAVRAPGRPAPGPAPALGRRRGARRAGRGRSARSCPVYPLVMVGAAVALAIGSLIVGERAGSGRMLARELPRRGDRARSSTCPGPSGVLPSDAPAWTVARRRAARRRSPRVWRPWPPSTSGRNRLAGARPRASPSRSSPRSSPPAPTASPGRAGRRCSARPGWPPPGWSTGARCAASPTLDPGVPHPVRRRAGHRCGVLRGRLRARTSGARRSAGGSSSASWRSSAVRRRAACPLVPGHGRAAAGSSTTTSAPALLGLLPAPPEGAQQPGAVGRGAGGRAGAGLAADGRARLRPGRRRGGDDAGALAGGADPGRAASWPRTSTWPPARPRIGSGRLLGPDGRPLRARARRRPRRRDAGPPAPVATPARPSLDSLDRQLDLRRVELGDDSLVAYENTAWLPVRAVGVGRGGGGEPAGRGRRR